MRFDEFDDDEYDDDHRQYVAAFFEASTNNHISKLLKDHNVPNPVMKDALHCTIAYSDYPIDFSANFSAFGATAKFKGYAVWNTTMGRTFVMLLESEYLTNRFNEAIKAGMTYEYDEYRPHITLSEDIGICEMPDLPKPEFEILIAGEYEE